MKALFIAEPGTWRITAMLVLSRKPGEKILIGENVTITIVRIGPNTVRLGIEAPREMNILRGELDESAQQGEPTPVVTH